MFVKFDIFHRLEDKQFSLVRDVLTNGLKEIDKGTRSDKVYT